MSQILVNGLLTGGLYALVAVGFSLVWGVMNVVNIAHASYIMLGAYITYWLFHLYGLDPFLSIPVSMAALFLLGYAVGSLVLNRVVRFGLVMTLVLTFGIDMILQNGALLLWSADYRSITPAYAGQGLAAGGVMIPYVRLAVFVLAVLFVALFSLFLSRTRMGNAIKATALNPFAAELNGVRIQRVYALTYAIGAALAAAAGSMVSVVYTIHPQVGNVFLTRAFVITVLGGLGSIPGALLGGVILGLAESLATVTVGIGWSEAISFTLLVAILIVRPQGLLGKRFFGGVG
ncbi:MAG: branched-chain amino acid ABC transporter permease [Firmicutes bacterium]|nr:branched-chain amino acid ABC transporter permease [Bacillota bacterium]